MTAPAPAPDAPGAGAAPPLSLRGIAKSYGPVRAVQGVDLDIWRGDIPALCGDNGAGKSTLIKMISGVETPSAGEMRLNGAPVAFHAPQDALRKGVATIHQDLALAPRLSIWENVFMGAELTRGLGLPLLRILYKAAMMCAAKGYLARLAVGIEDMRRPVEDLSGGQRQAVARVATRVAILKSGRKIIDRPLGGLTAEDLGRMILTGREIAA